MAIVLARRGTKAGTRTAVVPIGRSDAARAYVSERKMATTGPETDTRSSDKARPVQKIVENGSGSWGWRSNHSARTTMLTMLDTGDQIGS